MAVYDLVMHPDSPALGVSAVSVDLSRTTGRPAEYFIEYCIAHNGSLRLPPMSQPARADNLWKTTCCELFVAPEGRTSYLELNLSPSLRWAAYAFDDYRSGMRELDLASEPEISITPETKGWFWLAAELNLSAVGASDVALNLAVVVEEIDGTKSYWALAHAPGPPDFHNRDCWTATLPAPDPS